jgi:hypothetical protein
MPLGAFRGGNPLERIVAYSDRWARASNHRLQANAFMSRESSVFLSSGRIVANGEITQRLIATLLITSVQDYSLDEG